MELKHAVPISRVRIYSANVTKLREKWLTGRGTSTGCPYILPYIQGQMQKNQNKKKLTGRGTRTGCPYILPYIQDQMQKKAKEKMAHRKRN